MSARVAALRAMAVAVAGVAGAAFVGTVICRLVAGFFVPGAAFAEAGVIGVVDALFAIGLVLVYRASRIVNFAQGSLGVLGVSLFVSLMSFQGWPFLLAFPAALAVAAMTGLAVEVLVVRRLSQSPRLALTVVTIGVSQLLGAVAGFIPLYFLAGEDEFIGAPLRTPFSSFEVTWYPLVFTGDHAMVVVMSVLALAGLASFFRYTHAGTAVRGAAENSDRAELLGISVHNLSSVVWVMAATLSCLAAVLGIFLQSSNVAFISAGAAGAAGAGSVGAASAGAGLLLRGLAAAVVGRMERLPTTVAASIGIAVFDRAMFWTFDNTAMTNVALLAVIVGALLIQRNALARTDDGVHASWAGTAELRAIPHELRDLPNVRAVVRRARTALVLLAVAFPWVMSPTQTSIGSVWVIYGIVVISLVVLTGWGGQISLGQFGFVAIGAVVGGALTAKWDVPFLLALVLASTIGAVIAVAVGLPAMRIRGLFLAVTTLGFAVVVTSVVLNPRFFGWLQPGDIPRPKLLFLDTNDERVFFYVAVASLLLAVWVARGIRNSRAGRVLIAMRENERTAQAYGINRVRTRLATFAISGFLASFAGVLLAHQQQAVRALGYTPAHSIQIFLIALIGGLGSVGGSLVGVAYMAAVRLFVPGLIGQLLASGVGVILILLFYPGGLGAMAFALRDAWLRRVAMRGRIYVPSLVGDHRVLDGEHVRAALAPLDGARDAQDNEVPVVYRVPSAIGVRGESQQGHGWRWAK